MEEIVGDRRVQWGWTVGNKRTWEEHVHSLEDSHDKMLGLDRLKTKSPRKFKEMFDIYYMLLCRTYYEIWGLGLTPSKKEVRRLYLWPIS